MADLSLQASRQQQGEEDQHGASEPESYTVIRTEESMYLELTIQT